MVGAWSDLPADLLQPIADILVDDNLNLVDYVRFRAVCVRWRSCTVDPHNLKRLLSDRFPWALRVSLGFKRGDNTDTSVPEIRGDIDNTVTFLRLSDRETFHTSVPEIRGDIDNIVGSDNGWLAVIYIIAPAIRLLLVNPLTRAQIHLPPLASLAEIGEYHNNKVVTFECFGYKVTKTVGAVRLMLVRKVVLSEDHTVVMVYIRCFNMLAFVSPGDERWTMINLSRIAIGNNHFSNDRFYLRDILHHKGSFYVVDFGGRLAICNLVPSASITQVASVQVDNKFFDSCLVSSGEELFLIAGYFQTFDSNLGFEERRKFQVFRLDPSSKSTVLEEVKSLGDRILFLGSNRSLCLSARDCPPGYKPNSIYIAIAHEFRECSEFGYYNLEEGCYYKHLEQEFQSSTWFTPSLC